jgi:transcription elongation factor GreA
MAEKTLSVQTLSEAVSAYVGTVKAKDRGAVQTELQRFLRWYGPDKTLAQLQPHLVANYALEYGSNTPDADKRIERVRSFLSWLKKNGLTETNLATHLRLRKTTGSSDDDPLVAKVKLTAEGFAAHKSELEGLYAERPKIAETLREAMADKDFRENAPLDAARDQQAQVEARIRELEHLIRRAEVIEGDGGQPVGGGVGIGNSVKLVNVNDGRAVVYQLVSPSEVSLRAGKISTESPVGAAIMGRRVGDEVEVKAPAGALRYKIESIDS